jgi:hypothetical protein
VQREDAPQRDHGQSKGNDVDECGIEGKEQTSDRRAGDMRELEGDGPLRESAHEQLLRHERRRQRPARRSADSAPDAEHGGEHEERPNAVGAFQRDRE